MPPQTHIRLIAAREIPQRDADDLAAMYRRPTFMLRRAFQVAESIFDREFAAVGLTMAQYDVLLALVSISALDQSALARALGLDPSNAAAVVTRLLKRGLISRTRHASDRRKVTLALSKSGQAALRRGKERATTVSRLFVAPVEPLEIPIFRSLLSVIAHQHVDTAALWTPIATDDRPSTPLRRRYEDPCFLIRRAYQVASAAFTEASAAFGITSRQFAMLTAIVSRPGIDQITLAGLAGSDRSTTALVVSNLEAAKLIKRNPDPEDRRRWLLTASAAGIRSWKNISRIGERVQARVLSPLTPRQRQHVVLLLEKLLSTHNAHVRAPLYTDSER
jgi:DNA-binding MarR family transcriptional regulator